MAGSSTQLVGNTKDLIGAADKAQTRKVNKELGKDAFLQLLVSQLKHQDPMKPMDDTSFISQMAQFSSLEQSQNMYKLMEQQTQFANLSQASSMIGKNVSLVLPGDKGGVVNGVVEEVRQSGAKTSVVVNGQEYDASTINKVSDKPIPTASGGKAV